MKNLNNKGKGQNIKIALEEKKKEISDQLLAFHRILNEQFKVINSTLNEIGELNFKFNIIENIGKEDTVDFIEHSDLIEITNYIEGEIISFETKLFPSNYHQLETYGINPSIKNRIRVAVLEKLKSINWNENNKNWINTWDEGIVIFEIKKEGRIADFDNYYMKPYVDGIVLSKFIKNDSSDKLEFIYKNLESNEQMVRVTLINRIHFKKYLNSIFEV